MLRAPRPITHHAHPSQAGPDAIPDEVIEVRIAFEHVGCIAHAIPLGASLVQLSEDRRGGAYLLRADGVVALDEALDRLRREAPGARILAREDTTALLRIAGAHACPRIAHVGDEQVVAWPITFRDGKEHARVVCASAAAARELVARLALEGAVEVAASAQVPVGATDLRVPMGVLTSGLTRRQLDALAGAIDAGYYQVPRRTSTLALAERFGVGRTTYEEHLRKAERSVLVTLGELVAEHGAFTEAARKGRGRPKQRM